MKIKNSSHFFMLFLLMTFTVASAFPNRPNPSTKSFRNDSTLVKSGIREVFTSQQLFVTEVHPIKKGKSSKRVKFKAELRDAFKVICYDADSSHTELNWVRLNQDYGQPRMGLYYPGTPEYQKLDSLIIKITKKVKKT